MEKIGIIGHVDHGSTTLSAASLAAQTSEPVILVPTLSDEEKIQIMEQVGDSKKLTMITPFSDEQKGTAIAIQGFLKTQGVELVLIDPKTVSADFDPTSLKSEYVKSVFQITNDHWPMMNDFGKPKIKNKSGIGCPYDKKGIHSYLDGKCTCCDFQK